jgi:hypothetical protein
MHLFVILYNEISFVDIADYQCDTDKGDLGSL